MSQVFISYSRKDIESVRPFYELASKQEKNLWIDWNGIYPTEDFMEKIFQEIEASDACVFMLSPSWLSSKPCQLEFEHAVRCNKRLIPVLCAPIESTAVPRELARLSWIQFRAGDSISQTLEEVYLAVDIDLEWVREHSQLLRSASHWEAHQRDTSYCLRGRELRELEKRISLLNNDTGPALTSLQIQFLSGSRRLVNTKMRTVIFALSSSVIVFAALALFATAMYFQAERRRTLVSAQQLASRARLILQERADWLDPCAQAAADAVLRLSSIGESSVEANYALQTVGALLPVRKSAISHPSAVWDISVNDKGNRLACRYADYGQMPEKWNARETGLVDEPEPIPNRKVPIWNLDTNQLICEIEWTGEDVIEHVQISHSGKLVLIASANRLEVWDIDTNLRMWQFEEANLSAVTFSHDDSNIVVFAESIKFFSIAGTLIQDLDLEAKIYATGDSSLTEKYLIVHTEAIDQARDESTQRLLDELRAAVAGQPARQSTDEQPQSDPSTNGGFPLLQLQEMDARAGKFSIWRKRKRWEPSSIVPFSSGSQAFEHNYGWRIRDADDTAVLFQGKGVEVWNLKEDTRIAFFEVGNDVEVVAIHPTEPLVAVATFDRTSLWRIEDDEAVEVAVIEGVAHRLQFSPDGRFLATASNDNTARIWSLRDANREAFRLVHEFWIGRLEFCGLSDRVVTACGFQALSHPDQANVRIWELTPTWCDCLPYQCAASYLEREQRSGLLTQSGIPTISNGQLGITSLSGDETKILASFPTDEVQFVDASQDGATAILASATTDYGAEPSFQVVGAGAERFKLPPKIEMIDLSPDGTRIVICIANRLQVFEQGFDKPVFDKTFDNRIDNVRFAPDSQQAAISIGDGKAVKLIKLSDGSTIDVGAQQRTNSVFGYRIHFSPNSQVLTLDGLDTVEAWKLSTVPQLIYRIEDSVETGDISKSGNYLALKPHDRTVRIVDLRLGKVIATVQDAEQILTCAFSPNEEHLATGSGDLLEQPKSNAIRIWEAASGRLLFQRDELVNPLELEFTTSGDELLIRKQDRSVSIYYWKADRLVKEVGARLTGNMSRKTWSNLLPGVDFRPTFAHLPITIESE